MAIINRETDYAIRILRALKEGNAKSVPAICEEQNFKQSFAYKIIKKLENAGFVTIERGKSGGVKTVRGIEDKNLYELMGALDNTIYVNECFRPDYRCEFCDGEYCNTHVELMNLQRRIDKELKDIKLKTLL